MVRKGVEAFGLSQGQVHLGLPTVIPATGWDGDARGWTVLDRMQDRQARMLNARTQARRRLERDRDKVFLMTAALGMRQWRDSVAASWSGGFNLLAFVFAPPDTEPIRMLDSRGEYFDIRSGNTWDLFFPGYYRSDSGDSFERQSGGHPVGHGFARDWFFNPREFDNFRRYIETESAGRWQYSGESDLVVATAYLPEVGDVTVDWESVRSGQVTDSGAGTHTLTLGSVIEKISTDLEQEHGEESYGVSAVVSPPVAKDASHSGREFMVAVLAQLAAALASKPLGL